jgi:hypothetical protein
MSENY